jgi:uncharacterized protein YmfQ (DUF2313 family)
VGLSAESHARQLKQLLPRGSLWILEPGSTLSKLLLAISDELARVHGRGEDLVEEWDPSTTDELLADWERVLGIPEEGMTLATLAADRRLAVARKYVSRGGQTPYYLLTLAALAGFPVVSYDEVSPYVWRLTVDVSAATVAYTLVQQDFRAGTSRAGDRTDSHTVPQLEPIILRDKPAHTSVWFAYT